MTSPKFCTPSQCTFLSISSENSASTCFPSHSGIALCSSWYERHTNYLTTQSTFHFRRSRVARFLQISESGKMLFRSSLARSLSLKAVVAVARTPAAGTCGGVPAVRPHEVSASSWAWATWIRWTRSTDGCFLCLYLRLSHLSPPPLPFNIYKEGREGSTQPRCPSPTAPQLATSRSLLDPLARWVAAVAMPLSLFPSARQGPIKTRPTTCKRG